MNNIKNCPHCGKPGRLSTCKDIENCTNVEECTAYKHYYYPLSEMYTVVCDFNKGGCGACGGYYLDEEKAIEAWNKRIPVDKVLDILAEEVYDAGNMTGTWSDYDPYYSGKENAYEYAIELLEGMYG